MKRDLLTLADLTTTEIEEIFVLSKVLKAALKSGRPHPRLAGRTLAMIFEKPSLRTRVSFEIGMFQLGGSSVYLAPQDIQLGRRESVSDIARNLSRWVDMIVARTFSHETLVDLAAHSTVPVINGLSDWSHPCQVLADCFTLLEKRKRLAGLRLAFVGDGNNMVHSFLFASAKLGIDFRLACPPGYEPSPRALEMAADMPGARIRVTESVAEAVRDADVIYTDVWTSMGQEAEGARRRRAFRSYQVNREVLGMAAPNALVMHCLPAHRGEEITDEVLDGPQSIVLDQAENRLHVQKGIMVWLAQAAGERVRNARRPVRLLARKKAASA
ncbi:MAG: ornithine carbamoyltransferase [Candidatus Binatota bacterium]|nr:ornithine carbamoyltransferase [Candidatus Binatota bacterium]